jgi:hypothetical protein
MEEELYGASNTNPRSLAGMGVLNSLSGGRGDLVQQYVNEAVPLPKKADPYVAALKFFIEMGKQASQPGATVLGSITGSMGAPVDYLEAKALERQKAEQARSALGLQIAPSLKPGKATYGKPDFYMVSRLVDGKLTEAVETPLTPKQFDELQPQIKDGSVVITAVPKAGTSVDNTRMDVILRGVTDDPSTTIDERFTSILRSDFDTTKHLPTSALPKNSSTSEDKTRMNVILRNTTDDPATPIDERIISILRSDYDETKHLPTESLPEQKLPPQGSAPERATNRVLDFVDAFTVDPNVDPRLYATFLNDVELMSKPQIISFQDAEGNMQSASTPGIDAYKFISQSYGPEVANAIKALSKNQNTIVAGTGDGTDAVGGTGDSTKDDGVKKIMVAGKEFTVFSSTPASMPKEASDAIVDAAGALRDINIAYDLLFPDGKLNRAAIVAANFLPDGGLNRTKVDTDSRTAYQSMRRVIELILRARTGAAAPEAEVQNYLKLYFPASLDNDDQARNKFITLAQYFTDTTRILSQGRLLYDPNIPEADRKFDPIKHGIPLSGATSQAANDAPDVVTVTSEWTLGGVKYKQLSDGRIISEE